MLPPRPEPLRATEPKSPSVLACLRPLTTLDLASLLALQGPSLPSHVNDELALNPSLLLLPPLMPSWQDPLNPPDPRDPRTSVLPETPPCP